MRLKIMAATSVAKAINKARTTGRLSLVAAAKLNLLAYYMEFALAEIALGREIYKDKYELLVSKFNSLVNTCPDTICNIRASDCSSGTYESTAIVRNPYNPQAPPAPVVEPVDENLPPTIADNSILVENNITTTLTIDMFTSVYSDPENDLLDAIRIDKIHSTNLGIFYVSGIELQELQIITREQIEANLFTHVGADISIINTDSFEFSARDEGSQTWVN